MKHLLLCLASAFLFFSCSEPKTDGVADRITIDWEAPAPKWNVQKIVPLETKDEALFNNFFRVFVTDRNIFVQDFTRVLVFDSEGKYLSKIERIGHGPQEYIDISHFWPFEDKIYIVDSQKDQIQVYSLSGEFVRSLPTGPHIRAMAVAEQFMAFKSSFSRDNTLTVTDHHGNKLYDAISPILAKTTYAIPAMFPFTEAGGEIYYLPDFSSSIYTVGADTSDLRKTTFDFGVYTLTPELVSTLTATTSTEIFAKNEVVHFLSFYPTRLWWGLTFSLKGNTYQWYYNTKTGKQYINTLKGSREFKPIACATEECFVASVEASAFLEDERFAPYREGMDVGEEDNAVLIFYTVE